MTGIERLRQMAKDFKNVKTAKYCTFIANMWRGRYIDDAIADIADQIEREAPAPFSRLMVLSVVGEMELYVRARQYCDELPEARWAHKLRKALDAGRDPADDVSMSAYDLLPQEDREAIAWVREHGGLDAVDAIWDNDVPLAEAVISELWPDGRLDECGNDDVMGELHRRLMPEGVEWPRHESGELVGFGDTFEGEGEPLTCHSVTVNDHGDFCLNDTWFKSGQRVKRPAPKVLDADGVEIRVGDTVYDVDTGEKIWVCALPEQGEYQCVKLRLINGMFKTLDPCRLTHRAPVLAADGRPLEVGQTVWDANDDELVIGAIEDGGHTVACRYVDVGDGIPTHGMWSPSDLTHQRPVLDAEGVPIKVGDTVYFTDGREQECNTVVRAEYDYKDEPYVQLGRLNEVGYPKYTNCSCIDPSQLTHAKPEPPDSWEKVEEDIFDGFMETEETTRDLREEARDIVRRCKALAERERGER